MNHHQVMIKQASSFFIISLCWTICTGLGNQWRLPDCQGNHLGTLGSQLFVNLILQSFQDWQARVAYFTNGLEVVF